VGKVRAVVVVATRSGSGGRRLEAKSKRVYREAVGGAVGCGAVTAMWSSEPPSRKDPRRRRRLCLCSISHHRHPVNSYKNPVTQQITCTAARACLSLRTVAS
jgi:hypothetical protein